jgi:hypothetical protein
MTSVAIAAPPPDYARLRIPAAAFELLAYLVIVAATSLAFLAGWLTVNAAIVLTVLLLGSLIVLSWIHLGQGRHPVFLFLCTLMLFQGGRLLAYCLGAEPEPLRIELLTANPFFLSRAEEGITLLCLVVSAGCIYGVCRWNCWPIPPPDLRVARPYLTYLYLVFYCSLPTQLLKNYLYLRYVQANGGYLVFFTDYAGLVASVPPIVRVLALVTFPVFIAIFVFETRKKLLWLATTLYFASAALFLLTGSRMDTFSLILTLWYVSRVKSVRRSRVLVVTVLAVSLVLLSNAVQLMRFDEADQVARGAANLPDFVLHQGISINVTEVAVRYRSEFQPHIGRYLLNETMARFISSDVSKYHWGDRLGPDISAFLNPELLASGFGGGGSYLAQAYILAGGLGVVGVSLLIGAGLRQLYNLSCAAFPLVLAAIILPDVFLLPRGGILVWLSTTIRTALVAVPLVAGWLVLRLLSSIGRTPPASMTLPVSK